MSRALPILARWLHALALALWLGGLVVIGALVAPTAFHVVRINPALAGNAAGQAALAGGIVGGSLRLLNLVCYACGVLFLLGNGLLLARGTVGRAARVWTGLMLVIALVLLASAVYQGLVLFPAMDAAQGQGNMSLFDALHRRYERMSLQLQFPLLLMLTLLGALRDTPPVPAVVKKPSG